MNDSAEVADDESTSHNFPLMETEVELQTLPLDLTSLKEVDLLQAESHLKIISPQHKGYNELPIELHELIFKFAIPPDGVLDPSLDSAYSIIWKLAQQDKLSFVNVSKAWYQGSIKFLYKNIVIRHVGQIVLLRRTFEETKNLGSLPSSISVSCYIPQNLSESSNQDIQLLHSLCSTAEFNLYFPVWMPQFTQHLLSSPPLLTTFSMAKSLYLDGNPTCVDAFFDLVRHNASSLRCLILRTLASIDYTPDATPIELPELEQLVLLIHSETPILAIREMKVFLATWKVPKLKRFTFDRGVLRFRTDTDVPRVFAPFLKLNGHNLRKLQLIREWTDIHYSSAAEKEVTLQRILEFCPRLEHLVLETDIICYKSLVLRHPTLKYLDVWDDTSNSEIEAGYAPQPFRWGGQIHETETSPKLSSASDTSLDSLIILDLRESDLPQLRIVRRLVYGLPPWQDLPFVLHPEQFGHPDEEGTRILLGRSIQVSAGVLYRIENIPHQAAHMVSEWLDDNSEGSLYSPSDTGDSEDSLSSEFLDAESSSDES